MLRLLIHLFLLDARAGEVGTEELTISDNTLEAWTAARHALESGRFEEAATAWGALADAGGGPTARLAEAIALYEGGSLRRARAAAEQALAASPGDVAALNVLGVTLVDHGAREEGLRKLREALPRATGVWRARLLVNIALACTDGGDAGGADAALQEAAPLVAGNTTLETALAGARTARAALQGSDGGVGQALARGDLAGARVSAQRQAEAATSGTPRAKVAAAIALAAVERAEGRLGAAGQRLDQAASLARQHGLLRELSVALANMGFVHSLAGRGPIAVDVLRAAVEQARLGGYRVVEVDARTELGLALTRVDDAAGARAQLQASGVLLASMQYGAGMARQAELGGAVSALEGDASAADTALTRAVGWYEAQGRWMDAARAATTAVAAWEGKDPARTESWVKRAQGLFQKGGDALGPAHLWLARGLSAARAKRTDAAIEHFGRAAQHAKGVSGERASVLVEIARQDAAKVLVRAGDTPENADRAARGGLEAVVKREKDLRAGFAAYDQGRAAYDSRDFAGARVSFQASKRAFEGLNEPGYARRAGVAAGWAAYNRLVGLPVAKAHDEWQALVEEVTPLAEDELYLRTYAAAVLATHKVTSSPGAGRPDPATRLAECAKMAEQRGFPELAGRCLGALAERPGALANRADYARRAFAFASEDPSAVYAVYAVAVDALNDGQPVLARELATLARPKAGNLAGAIDGILSATR